MNRLHLWATSILALIGILISVAIILGLMWYAIFGNPAKDAGHFIKEVRSSAK